MLSHRAGVRCGFALVALVVSAIRAGPGSALCGDASDPVTGNLCQSAAGCVGLNPGNSCGAGQICEDATPPGYVGTCCACSALGGDHFLRYSVENGPNPSIEVVLADQFGWLTTTAEQLFFFANPVAKTRGDEVDPIGDPDVHLAWYVINGSAPLREIYVTNQFGKQLWIIGQPTFLLTPAFKNPGPDDGPPLFNHFECFTALSDPLNEQVTLQDQFVRIGVTLERGLQFCLPTSKTVNGETTPLVSPELHLACYEFTPVTVDENPTYIDQFVSDPTPVHLTEADMLCVPSLKTVPPTVNPIPSFAPGPRVLLVGLLGLVAVTLLLGLRRRKAF